MKDTLILQDKNYISAKRVCELFNYTTDYVGQLCRAGKLDCKMIGRSWYVTERSIIDYKSNKNYISTKKVHELFGYTSDYVGQLCRAGKLDCKMIGRAWFVTEKSVLEHMSTVEEIAKTKSLEKKKYNKKNNKDIQENVKPESKTFISRFILDTKPEIKSELKSELKAEIKKEIKQEIKQENILTTGAHAAIALPVAASVISRISPLKTKYVLSALVLLFVISTFVFSVSTNFKHLALSPKDSSASVFSASYDIIKTIINGFVDVSYDIVRIVTGESRDLSTSDLSPKVAIETPDPKFNGIAVVPSTNSVTEDETMKQKIRDSFSDEITVKPDKSGTAGVITPVFKKVRGNDFVYVLVPVKN